MRVKRLEIQGFKSFKDKTVIHFDHGITGIVGPNGCGKSNIVDAFFWVMGEQSYKHMRGSSSEDLIFNGSSKYSPMGLAEATMVLETGYDGGSDEPAAGATTKDIPLHLRTKEISVTRRVYRTGEGEYFINGVQARLKDIHELFMDTGVGAKGYSVIEQGQIGKIVNAKPEDRRLLIEEAAGIAKYKARKKESLRKMEATQENLSRLTDVIQEIERNLNSLERQAQKARSYKKLKDELLDKEMTWGRRKAKLITERLETLKSEKEVLEQELAGMKAELQTFENNSEVDRIEQLNDSKAAEELQARIQQLSNELTQERSALDLSKRRQNDLTSQVDSLEMERTELVTSMELEQSRLAEREAEVAGADEFFKTATQKAQSMDEAVRRLRQATEVARRELDAAKASLLAGVTQASELSSRSAVLTNRIESGRAQADRLAEQERAQADRNEQVTGEVNKHRGEVEQLTERAQLLSGEKDLQVNRVSETRDSLKSAETERDQSNRTLTQARSRLTSLEELADAYEGFADGPKAALEWARNSGQPLSVLADAFDVEPGYEAVLESWLEDRLESLFTDKPAFALEAIAELRGSKSGRVAIGVTEGRAETVASPTRGFEEVAAELQTLGLTVKGRLSDFVRATDGAGILAQRTAEALVSHVIAVESLDAANTLLSNQFSTLGGWSIVAADGNAFDAATGSLRGGSAAKDAAASVLRRKRAIAELKEQVAEAEARYSAAEILASELKQELEIATAKLQTTQGEIQEVAIERAARERDLHQSDRALREISTQLERSRGEIDTLRAGVETATAERLELEGELSALVADRTEIEAKILEGDETIHGKDAEVRAQEEELNALRVDEASLRERAGSLKREAESARSLIADRNRRAGEISRTLERLAQEREQFTGGESALIEKIEDLTRLLSSNRDELSTIKDRLEQLSARLNSAHDGVKTLHKTIEQKSSESTQLAIEGEKLSSEIAHLVQNLEEKYGPGCLERPETSPVQEEMTEPVITREMSAEEEALLGEEVERLRERIRRLGEVNTGAIEEYEEVKKRFDYLLTERGDLERSIENLKDAIEHINKTSEDRFKRAFEAIADRFERLFPIIFGGGKAELSLVYPEGSTDILEAGVDILAQPPGKKIVNITLLSGGEKALTAVSLIFAIFMVKPSPFCVLDEVDAPLDDANIGKFNALLREMSSKSQFILITHNKKTMELNDTLYGVTMEEPGVSKMVSIEMH